MKKQNAAKDEIDRFRGTKTGKFLGALSKINDKKRDTASSRGVEDDEPEQEHRNTKEDTNLPDEKKGKVVGETDVTVSDPDRYKDRKGHTEKRKIMGGDPDDPRWEEHNKRKKDKYYGVGAGSRIIKD